MNRRICVFCGAKTGRASAYADAARKLAENLVAHGCDLVYGGGGGGLMGVLADEVLALGGEVIGVIPRHLLAREVGHSGLKDMRVVDTHARAQNGDG